MSSEKKEKDFTSTIENNDYLSELFSGKANTVTPDTLAPVSHPQVPEHATRIREHKTKRAYLLMKPSLYKKVMEKAKREGTSLNQIVEDALLTYLS